MRSSRAIIDDRPLDLREGARVTWDRTIRGGYGGTIPVAARVVRVTRTGRVRIRYARRLLMDGPWHIQEVSVRLDRLRPRRTACAALGEE